MEGVSWLMYPASSGCGRRNWVIVCGALYYTERLCKPPESGFYVSNVRSDTAKIPECEAIVVTGQKAMETLIAMLPSVEEPKVGSYSRFTLSGRIFRLYRMPSSSRAYPKPLEEKAAVYKRMFEDLRMV